ncbi:glycosyltransferase [Ignavigranum ruoffiae]|uniref:glycosyltransferase n=1 Tax=Ignavigranum ruoffiae TaxID=89093 RepID=UPI00205A3B12|nr:glycosyltransferase [Ignavigranum ruoffiae]UPQ85247.1 glycosyltransferase [Ignavigranum ruoffiae]
MEPKRTVKTLRVLHIMSSYGGGISTFIQNIASEVHAFNIQFDVVTYSEVPDSFRQQIQHTGGDVYQLKNPKKEGWRSFKHSYTRVLELYPYDVIHCHIAGYRAGVYKLLARPYGVKRFYIHAHHILDDSDRRMSKQISVQINQQINRYLSDGYLGCSTLAIKSLFGYSIPSQQMMRIPNSIDPTDFLYDPDDYRSLRLEGRRKLGAQQDDLLFGQIGRLDPIKNHRLTLDIAQYMKEHHLPGRFLIVGQGELMHELQAEVQQRGLDQQVSLLGRVSPIAPFFPVIDALIFPSLREGLGTVAIESQAAGVPVVMSFNLPAETDLGLDRVKRVKLDQAPAVWYEALVAMSKLQRIPPQTRLQAIQGNQYTNKEAARLYNRYLRES